MRNHLFPVFTEQSDFGLICMSTKRIDEWVSCSSARLKLSSALLYKKTTLCHRLDYFWSSKSAPVCPEKLLGIISELPSCQGSAPPYLRPLKPAGHWQLPVMWSHTPPLRQEQSLLQLMPYLPRGHGWVQTEPLEKQPASNNVSQTNEQQSQFQ